MTKKQLQSLISAGVFSAALLTGVAYADNIGADAGTAKPAASTMKMKHKKSAKKDMAKHACAGQNSCKGMGGCATDGSMSNKSVGANMPQHSCKGKNACKGQGGCASS